MISMTASVCIDAPVEQVWKVLSELEAIVHWVPAIKRAHCPAERRGLGAARICELDQATIVETIEAWDEGRSLRYRGEGAPMMKRASNLWSVEAHGAQTLVTSTAEAELKGGVFGRLLEPLAAVMFRRLGARSLASLKYYVEHGTPFEGRIGTLLPAPSAC
ncbi:MAG: SRPBCC family protein [Myxococcaceae bacterium]|nr:SRPBCC family protein [Myxococcaceae bacterium]